ncbi:21094_t:CDS:1, partial [Gigaspora rosea]
DALLSLAAPPLKCLKHTNETQHTAPLPGTDINRKNKNHKSGDPRLTPSGRTMTLSPQKMSTNTRTKPDEDQIETDTLIDAPHQRSPMPNIGGTKPTITD